MNVSYVKTTKNKLKDVPLKDGQIIVTTDESGGGGGGGSSGVTSFNGRSGSILPIAGDYSDDKIILSSAMHIGGETQTNVSEALNALADNIHGGSCVYENGGMVFIVAGSGKCIYDDGGIIFMSNI